MTTLPIIEFAFPGPLRDQLVGAVLAGSKTSTTGLVAEYALDNEPLPRVGQQQMVIDSHGSQVGIVETTEVRVVTLSEVDEQHARDEGEGYTTVSEWRLAHEEFWHSKEMREAMNDSMFSVDDDTLVILERFRLVSVV